MNIKCGFAAILIALAGVAPLHNITVSTLCAQDNSSYTDSVTGITFPETLGPLDRGSHQDFEKDMPGLGSSTAYLSHDSKTQGRANIYIYNMKKNGIPADPNSSIVQAELKRSRGEITAMEDKGLYSNVKDLDSGVATMGKESAPKMRYIKLSFNTKDGKAMTSYILMTGYKNNFFKIRYSYPTEAGEAGDKEALRFFASVGKLLENSSNNSTGSSTTQGGESSDAPKKMKLQH